MKQVLYTGLRGRGLLATLLATLVLAVQLLAAQGRDEAVRIEEQEERALQPLTAAEIQQATTVLQGDNRILQSLASSQRVRTVFVERYEDDKDAPMSTRRAHVVLYNYDTNETTSVLVTLGPRPQVEELTVTKDQPPGLSTQEVEEAKQLALAHPAVQAKLRAAGLAGRGHELIITHLLARAAAPDDPCTTHRCVALFFNTRDAVVDIAPVVDLTIGEVEMQ